MFRRFFRGIRDGFQGVKRHFGMAFSAMSSVTLTLLLAGVFLVFAFNLATLTKDIEDSMSLSVLLDYDVNDLGEIYSIKTRIKKLDGVDRVDYRDKDEEFDFYNQEYPEMLEFSEIYREDNPFHNVLLVYMNDNSQLENVRNSVSNFAGVYAVYDGGDQTYTLIRILQSLRIGGWIVTGMLFFLAIYLIYNTIKITIASRKDEIWIMKNVGAKNSYIRFPFLVEGFIIGVFGSLIPIGMILYGYYYLFNQTSGVFLGLVQLIQPYPFIYQISLVLLLAGIIIGRTGSFISVCKYLRLTR